MAGALWEEQGNVSTNDRKRLDLELDPSGVIWNLSWIEARVLERNHDSVYALLGPL